MISEKFDLTVSSEYFHHHADGIIEKYSDLKLQILSALKSSIDLDLTVRTKQRRKSIGIKADSLNAEVRRLLTNIPDIEFEVDQVDGIYYKSDKIVGFDFAIIDKKYNIYNLRNLCFGKNRIHIGESKWDSYLAKHPEYARLANDLGLPCRNLIDEDIRIDRTKPVVVGEIQFGNWALAYRDFFKVLKANVFTDVDLLIYIVPDGYLADHLSDGTVNYLNTKEIIKDFKKVITVPTWLIGIDFQNQHIRTNLQSLDIQNPTNTQNLL